MSADRAVLLSIRPVFADAILRGDKTVELRRTRPNVPLGTPVLLYSSTPVKALVGVATLTHVEERTPDALWVSTCRRSAVTRTQFDTYFANARRAFGLHLTDVTALCDPLPLTHLRERWGVEPPQSFRYVSRTLADAVSAVTPRRPSLRQRVTDGTLLALPYDIVSAAMSTTARLPRLLEAVAAGQRRAGVQQ